MVEIAKVIRKNSDDAIHGVYRSSIGNYAIGVFFPSDMSPIGGVGVAPKKIAFSQNGNFESGISEWVQFFYPPEDLLRAMEKTDTGYITDRLNRFGGVYSPKSASVSYLIDRTSGGIAMSAVTIGIPDKDCPHSYKGLFVSGQHVAGVVSRRNGSGDDVLYHFEGGLTNELRQLLSATGKSLGGVEIEVPIVVNCQQSQEGIKIKKVLRICPMNGIESILS
ncbi:hypothetical protein HYT53_05870 [Candidatus Woesearchaeota archaeon]|nr:hypothetical protein [Candidatus Woesearchaeota archaeon]